MINEHALPLIPLASIGIWLVAHSPTNSFLARDPANSEMQFLSIITSASNRIIIIPDALLNISLQAAAVAHLLP